MSTELLSLAKQINQEHRLCQESMRVSMVHALRVGELLEQAKQTIQHGDWLEWVAKNCEFSERTAQAYMRLHKRWPELANTQRVADLSMREALLLLAETTGKPASEDAGPNKPPAIYTEGGFISTLQWATKRLKYIQSRPITNLRLMTNWITAIDICMKRAAGGVFINFEKKFGHGAEAWVFIHGHMFDFVAAAARILANGKIGKDADGYVIGIINPLVALDVRGGRDTLIAFGWTDLDGNLIKTPDIDDLCNAMIDVYYMAQWLLCQKTGQPWENAFSMTPVELAEILPAQKGQGYERID